MESVCPRAALWSVPTKVPSVFMVGVDPHKDPHTRAVLSRHEAVPASVRVTLAAEIARLFRRADGFAERRWAMEDAAVGPAAAAVA